MIGQSYLCVFFEAICNESFGGFFRVSRWKLQMCMIAEKLLKIRVRLEDLDPLDLN